MFSKIEHWKISTHTSIYTKHTLGEPSKKKPFFLGKFPQMCEPTHLPQGFCEIWENERWNLGASLTNTSRLTLAAAWWSGPHCCKLVPPSWSPALSEAGHLLLDLIMVSVIRNSGTVIMNCLLGVSAVLIALILIFALIRWWTDHYCAHF